MKGPIFMFAHIIAPHQPFVFDEHGRPVKPKRPHALGLSPEARANRAEYHEPYLKQLRFVNAKLKETVEAILSNSREAPIIIIQADHGPVAYRNLRIRPLD